MSAPATAFLLHSFGSAGRSWSAVRERLAAPSLAPDLPGFGAAPPLPQPSVQAYADWVLEELAALDGEVVLAGASMGGKIAMAVAARRPRNLRGLLLCAPSPPGGEPMEPDERRRQLSALGDHAAARKSVAASTLSPPDGPRFRDAVEDWLRTEPSTWRWWWRDGSREELDVAAIETPVTVMAGEEDERLGPEVQRRETMPRLAGAQLRSLPASRHLVALDQPAAVAEAIAWLAGGA